MVSRWIICCCLLLSPLAQAALKVEASINRNPVAQGETFVLEVVADEELDGDALDTGPLQQQFMVGQISVSRQTRIVNFDASRQTRWRIPLVAMKPGDITIPALTVAGQRTQAIALQVLKHDVADPARQQDVILDVKGDKQTIYPGEQLLLTVELYLGVDLQQGNLSAPALEQASIRQIGKDDDQLRLLDGRRFRVITRRYSVTIDKPGQYRIQGPVFQGELLDASGRDLFNRSTTPVLQKGKPLTVEVQPIPSGYQGHWLPAEMVSLHQEWQPEPDGWRVGEPVTRTITLTAAGVGKDALPLLTLDYPDGLRVYPDQQSSSEFVQANKLIAQLQAKQAVIPNRDGSLTLPAVRIPWWDVNNHQQQWAELPPQTVQVAAAEQLSPVTTPIAAEPGSNNAAGISPWWLLLPCSGWLLTTGLWGWQNYRQRRNPQPDTAETEPHNAHWRQLLSACKQHQPDEAYRHFCRWSRSPAAADLDPQQLQRLKRQLENHCFTPRPQPWDGSRFIAELKRLSGKPRQSGSSRSELPGLNP